MKWENAAADVIVIGGGPAGMSAAVWSTELGFTTILIEREAELGGQLLRIFNPIENYLGRRADNGREMMSQFAPTLEHCGLRRITGEEVVALDPGARTITLAHGQKVSWRALIVATGVRRRELGVRGETEFAGTGLLESGVRDLAFVNGKRVLIVGGGDAAFENALLFSDTASSVKIAMRGAQPRARSAFVKGAMEKSNVKILAETSVSEILGNSRVEGVRLYDRTHEWVEPVDFVLIRIGVVPNSELAQATLDLDAESYIKTNTVGETSITSIYAIGDVANPIAPTISTAVGTGASAAKAIYYALRGQKAI